MILAGRRFLNEGMKHFARQGDRVPLCAPLKRRGTRRRDFSGPPAFFQKSAALSIIYRTARVPRD